jgi:hypothetical protein
MQSVHSKESLSEVDINRLLSESVKTKLLSAEESYRLRDLLYQSRSAQEIIDTGIHRMMKKNTAA